MNHYHDLACDDRPGLDNCLRAFGLRVLAGQAHRFDPTTVVGRLVFGIFAALAERSERKLIRERGPAKAAGSSRCRKPGYDWPRAVMAHRDTSVAELCSELGIRPVTLYSNLDAGGARA